jgi:hypothetical protein
VRSHRNRGHNFDAIKPVTHAARADRQWCDPRGVVRVF